MTIHRLVVLALVVFSASPALSQDLEAIPGVAQLVAEKVIRPVMNNPRSAEFDRQSVVVDDLGDWLGETPSFKVSGVVRGTNAFNAVVPNRWTAYVVHADGKDSVAMVLLEDKVVHLGTRGADVVQQLAADKAAEEQRAADAKMAAKAKYDAEFEAERERRVEQAKQDAEVQRLQSIRAKGRRAGEQVAESMGKALPRVDAKEAERRAKREAARLKVDKADTDQFVHGFVAGVMDAKARRSAK